MSRHRRVSGSGPRPAARIAIGFLLGTWLVLAWIGPALGASPAPSPGADYGGDTRTTGQGPGLEGSPAYAIGGVVVVALISIAVTVLYVRATGGRTDGQARRSADDRDGR